MSSISEFGKKLWAVLARNVIDSSAKGRINGTDILKVLRNALFVGSSASLVFIIESLAENMLSSVAQGVAIAVLNGIVECLFKFLKNNEEKIEDVQDSQK
jgi:hypothetical protein